MGALCFELIHKAPLDQEVQRPTDTTHDDDDAMRIIGLILALAWKLISLLFTCPIQTTGVLLS